MNYLLLFFQNYYIYVIAVGLLFLYIMFKIIKRNNKPVVAAIFFVSAILFLGLQVGSDTVKIYKEIHEADLLGLDLKEVSFLYYTPMVDGNYRTQIRNEDIWYLAAEEYRYDPDEGQYVNNAYYAKLNEEGRIVDTWKVDIREIY